MTPVSVILFAVLFCFKRSGTVAWAAPATSSSTTTLTLSESAALPKTAASPSPSSSPPIQRYPQNLHRLYDGTWEVVSANPPFSYIPPNNNKSNSQPSVSPSPYPPTTTDGNNTRRQSAHIFDPETHTNIATDNTLHINNNKNNYYDLSSSLNRLRERRRRYFQRHPSLNSNSNNIASRIVNIAFQKKTGFALLTADNHRSPISPNLNIVFGDLILRDGAYRTQRDVSLHLAGVYELSSGTLVVVGDIMYDTSSNALSRLYDAFQKTRPITANESDYFNVTKEGFVDVLKLKVEKYRDQFRPNLGSDPAATGVAAQCPFYASFAITPGRFNDSVPLDNDYPNVIGPGHGIPLGGNTEDLDDFDAGDHVTAPGPLLSSGRSGTIDDGVSAQDEIVEMKGTFISEACKTEMTVRLETLDTETLFGKAINYTLLVTVVSFIQVIVLIRQMEMTSTQAGARRVSLMTVGLQAVADSYLCLGHLTMGIAVQTLFNAFATAAFFKFICFSIFLMRWMLLIWKARRPSGFSEGWEAMRRELSMLYTRFYSALVFGIILLYQLKHHVRLFVFALYSFWVPQIVLNVVEDHRRPLLPIYILATSITRLAIPLYFWGCPQNFLHIEPQPMVAISLVAWLGAQALILLSQYKFGPRWFIPKEFLPEKYDYFRTITIEDDEVIDLEASNGDDCGNDGDNCVAVSRPLVGGEAFEATRECCICMESVQIHSRDRMVTPCNHFFHAVCLERWLEVRLECALCRSSVPPP